VVRTNAAVAGELLRVLERLTMVREYGLG